MQELYTLMRTIRNRMYLIYVNAKYSLAWPSPHKERDLLTFTRDFGSADNAAVFGTS